MEKEKQSKHVWFLFAVGLAFMGLAIWGSRYPNSATERLRQWKLERCYVGSVRIPCPREELMNEQDLLDAEEEGKTLFFR